MKFIYTLFFFIAASFYSYAQGNLQFNQARIITETDGPQTVPAGKVWKIESILSDGNDSYVVSGSGNNTSSFSDCGLPSIYLQYYGRYISISGTMFSFGIMGGQPMSQLPLWVQAGQTICLGTSSTYSAKAYSMIEFNIVP